MPYHNPTSLPQFQGGISYIRWAATPLYPRELDKSAILNLPSDTGGSYAAISINHLPLEILAEIFLICSKRSECRFHFDRPVDARRWRAPLLLCQVCRHWREVAISLPLLWCSLSGTGDFTPLPAFIALWLARSRGLPLSLTLAAPSGYNDKPKYHAHASKMFDLFSNEMHRWRTIAFTLNDNLARQFIATADSKAQILEELELVFEGPSSTSAEVSALLPSLPKLRHLSWYGNLSAMSLQNIPFYRLTHIYITSRNSVQDVITCLSQCAMALKIRWHFVKCGHSSDVFGLPQTTLFHLQSLDLEGTGNLAHILSKLTLPSLKYLCMATGSETQYHGLLEDFFNRSSCPLQKFILVDDCIDQESVIKYLSIPFLETIPDIEVYLGGGWQNDVLQKMQEVKDSQDTPTFRRLQISYPTCNPAFTWK